MANLFRDRAKNHSQDDWLIYETLFGNPHLTPKSLSEQPSLRKDPFFKPR